IMSKGISPLVATVILIGITMATSAFLAVWAIGFFTVKLPSPEEKKVCRDVMEVIVERCFVSGNEVFLKLYNFQNFVLPNLTAQMENDTYTGSINLLGDLNPGELKTFRIKIDVDNFSRLIISSRVCPQLKKETVCR
ncbi:MAG: archaellin/type IV pilin N-terminal domain-containing protein, partial [Candidatus Aenigmarchaeota archaeon]|nr:hypothetical protein [Candidatus Aenigmarchaeota archaeon]MDW8149437.1 archaellin/type IV pilin N-terminal domain-containing protein [Candidatus Aenigmarchaeota archaeon]